MDKLVLGHTARRVLVGRNRQVAIATHPDRYGRFGRDSFRVGEPLTGFVFCPSSVLREVDIRCRRLLGR